MYQLFIDLDADDEQIEFPIVYTNARAGQASLEQGVPGTDLRLKWPNDLLLGGAKCAGILCQGGVDAAGTIGWVVFGIGVNLAPAAATAINSTFGISLPTDGSLRFGTASVLIKG